MNEEMRVFPYPEAIDANTKCLVGLVLKPLELAH
jgi:hypothetical protein